jgi:hypothetical protein
VLRSYGRCLGYPDYLKTSRLTRIPLADRAGIDPELWEHVSPEIQAEAWDKVALGAVIFTGLEPATNGFASDGSGRFSELPIFACAAKAFASRGPIPRGQELLRRRLAPRARPGAKAITGGNCSRDVDLWHLLPIANYITHSAYR